MRHNDPPRTMEVVAQPQADLTGDGRTHERWVVAIVGLASFMTVTSGTMVNVALPPIGAHFGVDAGALGWLVSIYLLTFGVAMPFHGRLGDRFGERRIYLAGMVLFVIGAALAGLAVAFPMLVVARCIQGLGAGAITSLGMAMVARTVPPERRGRTMGIVATAVSAGAAIGPTLGGIITQLIAWRMVFLFAALLTVVIPLAARYLPPSYLHQQVRIDWLGGIAVGAAVSGALLAVTNLQRQGGLSGAVIAAAIVGLVGTVLTIHRQQTVAFPFIDRALLANRRYLLLTVVGFLTMSGGMGVIVVAPFLYTNVNGLPSGQVGLALLPQALVVVSLAGTAGRLADRWNPFVLIVPGLLISCVTVLFLSAVAIGWPAPAFSAVTMFLGLGQALVNAPLMTVLTRTIPARIYGVGLGIFNMLFFVGTSLGAAVATALLESRAGARRALLPFYVGAEEFSEYSDALLVGTVAFALAAVAAFAASRARVPRVELSVGSPEPRTAD